MTGDGTVRHMDPARVLRHGGAAGTAPALGLVALASVAGFVPGAAGLVSYGYLAAASLLAWRLVRRHPQAFLIFVLWLWLLTPEVRRITNYTGGWLPDDPIMAAPGIASLIAARGLIGRRLPQHAAPLVLMLVALGYGFLVGTVQAGPSAALAGLVYWLPPVLVGLLAMSTAVSPRELHGAVGHIAVWGTLVLGVYGLVQFVVLPEWDAAWMVASELTTIGSPEPQKVRVFSTMNSPGPLAVALSGLLVALSIRRSRLGIVAAAAGVAVLGLSQVRSGWVGWVVGLGTLAVIARGGGKRSLALVAIPVFVVATFGGTVEETIRERFDQTTQAGASDDSLTARLRFHREMVPEALADPIGNGIGSTGVASSQAGPDADALGTFDGAIPEALFALGGMVGSLYLIATAMIVWSAVRGAHHRGPPARVAAAATTAIAVQVLFGNPLIAGSGVLLMVLAAAAMRSPAADWATAGPSERRAATSHGAGQVAPDRPTSRSYRSV